MKALALLGCLAVPLAAQASMRIVSVDREGPPPYEDTERRYRLEGARAEHLLPGQRLRIVRPGESASIGRLEVLSAGRGHAVARLDRPGEHFPLCGDRVVPLASPPLPPLPSVRWSPVDVSLRHPATPNPPEPGNGRNANGLGADVIYFLKGSAALSPGAIQKLTTWAEAWGRDGQWVLGSPQAPGEASPLVQARLDALRLELRLLGVQRVDVLVLPPEGPGKYDPVYVGKRP